MRVTHQLNPWIPRVFATIGSGDYESIDRWNVDVIQVLGLSDHLSHTPSISSVNLLNEPDLVGKQCNHTSLHIQEEYQCVLAHLWLEPMHQHVVVHMSGLVHRESKPNRQLHEEPPIQIVGHVQLSGVEE